VSAQHWLTPRLARNGLAALLPPALLTDSLTYSLSVYPCAPSPSPSSSCYSAPLPPHSSTGCFTPALPKPSPAPTAPATPQQSRRADPRPQHPPRHPILTSPPRQPYPLPALSRPLPTPRRPPPVTPFVLGSADTPPAMEPAIVLSNMRIVIKTLRFPIRRQPRRPEF